MIRYEMHYADSGYQYTVESPDQGRDDADRAAFLAAEFEPVGTSISMGIMIVYVILEFEMIIHPPYPAFEENK